MAPQLTDAHRATLRAICDTVVPSIERDPDPEGFWALSASAVGADAALADLIQGLPEEQLSGAIFFRENIWWRLTATPRP